MRRLVPMAFLMVGAAIACGDGSRRGDDRPGGSDREKLTDAGRFWVAWRPIPDPIPFNRDFELELDVREGGDRRTPIPDADIDINAIMRLHGHDMFRDPTAVSNGDGTYAVDGFIFFMPGDWDIEIDLFHSGGDDHVAFPVECCGGD